MCNVKSLESGAALQFFKDQPSVPGFRVMERDKLILSKCGGLPRVILGVYRYMTTTGPLGNLNEAFIHELEDSSYGLKGLFLWMRSYFRSCPDYLKPCVFYLPIFLPNHNVRRRRLLRRWIAEGYSRDTVNATAEQNAEKSYRKLVDLSMIHLQSVTTNLRPMSGTLCSVNGFFREYILSQPMEDNMVFALEERCSQNSQYTGRHLVIRSSWDRDRYVFESIDFSRLPSLTVFGDWKSFLVSEKMKVLRMLDLEDTSGVTNDDLEQIVKLLCRLKFLSLRGITSVSRLPTSLGNLKQLETLDVRHTSVTMLPPTIINLQKLQYIRAGTTVPRGEEPSAQDRSEGSWLPKFCRRPSSRLCVKVPRGMGKLMALDMLGVVDVGGKGGSAILKELKNLTQVRKLGVSGVNCDNVQDFYSAIMDQGHLESLSVHLNKDSQDFFCCRDNISEPLKESLRSLKLYGHVCKLPAWINQFSKLSKLDLEMTILTQEMIDFLAFTRFPHRLRLCVKPIQDDEVNISFRRRIGGYFHGVKIVEIDCSSRLQLTFGEGTMRFLLLLKVKCSGGSQISGLAHLRKLEKVWIVGSCDVTLKQNLEQQLEGHPNEDKPVC